MESSEVRIGQLAALMGVSLTSVTSIDIAMDAVGAKQSEETRFRIGNYTKAPRIERSTLCRWSAANSQMKKSP
ncbi:hypothetical protein BH20ACI3_BH20ACI3_04820 [soil metagenome]